MRTIIYDTTFGDYSDEEGRIITCLESYISTFLLTGAEFRFELTSSEVVEDTELWQVHLVHENNLEVLEQNLTKQEAIQRVIALANKWFKVDAVFTDIIGVIEYQESEEFLDFNEPNITMELMAA
jgi:hypothetical protein